jgi:TolA-binding protein
LGVTMGVSVSLSKRFTRECEQMETYRKDALRMFDRIGEMDENLHEMSNDISDLKSIANSLLLQNNKIEKLLESNTARND